MENVLKVSSKSNPNSVAGTIVGVISERGNTEIPAIKSITIARGFVAPSGVKLAFVPAFTDNLINLAAMGSWYRIQYIHNFKTIVKNS